VSKNKLLQEFPPKSKLDSKLYGDQNSTITEEHIKDSLDGLSIDEVSYLSIGFFDNYV
jgi:hypothetical protein